MLDDGGVRDGSLPEKNEAVHTFYSSQRAVWEVLLAGHEPDQVQSSGERIRTLRGIILSSNLHNSTTYD